MILFLDVISPDPEFVLIDNNKVIESLHIIDENHNKISDSLQKKFLMLQKKKDFINNLDYLIICIGPGSYTGLRVGISFMLGISYSKNIPIYGFSCVDLLSQFIIKKNTNRTILIICSANNQNFISLPFKNKYCKFKTYKIDGEYITNNINLKKYSSCISNYPLPEKLKNKTLNKIKCLNYKSLKEGILQYLPLISKKQSIIKPIYISENKLFD